MAEPRKILFCGHPAVRAVSTFEFYVCTAKDCDGQPRCANCGSKDLYPFVAPLVPEGAVACRQCGKVRWDPT